MRFSSLEILINAHWTGKKSAKLMKAVFPSLADLALSIESLLPQPIPLLLASFKESLALNQIQIASILANAFFCTFEENNGKSFNRINFSRLFLLSTPNSVEKLKCLLHYFEKFLDNMPSGEVSITRHSVNPPTWHKIDKPIVQLRAQSNGVIEDAEGTLQIDFANKYIGGGVLDLGCVQEEIRFLICPELIVSCLVCEKMRQNESILIVGAERYSDYIGYGQTFKWVERPCSKQTHQDERNRSCYRVVAIDAINFRRNPSLQFGMDFINRELEKAYAGFSVSTKIEPIATGNWGCGAFGGNPELKSMIQLLAASAANKSIKYFTFGNQKFADDLNRIVEFLHQKGVCLSTLHTLLIEYVFSSFCYLHSRTYQLCIYT